MDETNKPKLADAKTFTSAEEKDDGVKVGAIFFQLDGETHHASINFSFSNDFIEDCKMIEQLRYIVAESLKKTAEIIENLSSTVQ